MKCVTYGSKHNREPLWRVLFLSSMETGHVQHTGSSFRQVLESGNMGHDPPLTHDGHVALVRYKLCCVRSHEGCGGLFMQHNLVYPRNAGFLPQIRAPSECK